MQHGMNNWLQEFPQMVLADEAEGVKVVSMAEFAAGVGRGVGLAVSFLQ